MSVHRYGLFLALAAAACGGSSQLTEGDGGISSPSTVAADAGNPGSDASAPDATPPVAAADANAPIGDGAASDAPVLPPDGGTTMLVTFYGWDDNSPPGNAIAYDKSDGFATVHDVAGGTGTYADPLTMATSTGEMAIGTRVYLPFLTKYAIFEDDCAECDSDWSTSKAWHLDVWMASNGSENASALSDCEDSWTQDATTVWIAPPDGLPVSTTPLFTPATNACATPPSGN